MVDIDKQEGDYGIGEMKDGSIGGNARVAGASYENCTSAKMDLQSSVNGAAGNVQRDLIVNNNHYYNSSKTPPKGSKKPIDEEANLYEAMIVLTGKLCANDLVEFEGKKVEIKAIVAHLKKRYDIDLTIMDVSEGSVKLNLAGSKEDIEKLKALFESGELKEILDIPVQDVRCDNSLDVNANVGSDVTQSKLATNTNSASLAPKKFKKIPITRGEVAIVDDENFKELSQYKWYLMDGFAGRTVKENDKQTTIYMHRVVLDAPKGLSVCHLNGNKLDNRRENLCLVKDSIRTDKKKKNASHSSQYRGVYWTKDKKIWTAEIEVNKKHLRLGYFEDEKEAAIAYDKAAYEYYGPLAQTNFEPSAQKSPHQASNFLKQPSNGTPNLAIDISKNTDWGTVA